MKIIQSIAWAAALIATPFLALAEGEEQKSKPPVFTGEITEVDPDAGKLTITLGGKKKETKNFTLDSGTRVRKADGERGTVADLEKGTRIRVTPGESADKASNIRVMPPPGAKKDAPKKEKPEKPAAEDEAGAGDDE